MSLCDDVTFVNRGVKILRRLVGSSGRSTFSNSGFPSKRINLSPFTKGFRGGEHSNESKIFFDNFASAEFIIT